VAARETLADRLRRTIRDVPDFPQPGIVFKDITPVLSDAALFKAVTKALAKPFRSSGVTHVLAIESRGFIFGAPVAQHLGAALVPLRKPKKLPRLIFSESYELEYGKETLEMHADAFPSGARVLIVDDLLATGGTARAAFRLAKRRHAEVVGISVVIDLAFLPWREKLSGVQVETLVSFT
jgi:adenine phosphoribosyltransferase